MIEINSKMKKVHLEHSLNALFYCRNLSISRRAKFIKKDLKNLPRHNTTFVLDIEGKIAPLFLAKKGVVF